MLFVIPSVDPGLSNTSFALLLGISLKGEEVNIVH